jgi:nicotinamidase-related amidase
MMVIDMQQHFASLCEPIAKTVRRAVEGCRSRGIPVIFTQHGHSDARADGGMLADWWDDLIMENTAGHRLISGLGRTREDRVIAKRRYDAFFGTNLERLLREHGVEELTVAGVMTNLCVETTVREAFVRDFRVNVLMDATATATEEMHVASLVNMAFGFAHVVTTEEWLRDLTGS